MREMTHSHMRAYSTPREAIDAVASAEAGVSARLSTDEFVSYVSDGRGGVTRIMHYCNGPKITHRERVVRRAPVV